MFTQKSNLSELAGSGKTSIIGTGITITGDINTDADMRIDGKLIGTINSTAKVVIGSSGFIEGNVNAFQSEVTGKVTGSLSIKDLLNLKDKAEIRGDITAGKIMMEPTVTFNGKCVMNASSSTQVVEMIKEHSRKASGE
ncbi:MAG: bactofilin family protein [Ilyomonas sp.]